MNKWFEQTEGRQPNIVSSRVRLTRNLDQYRFPNSLNSTESEGLVKRL